MIPVVNNQSSPGEAGTYVTAMHIDQGQAIVVDAGQSIVFIKKEDGEWAVKEGEGFLLKLARRSALQTARPLLSIAFGPVLMVILLPHLTHVYSLGLMWAMGLMAILCLCVFVWGVRFHTRRIMRNTIEDIISRSEGR